MYNPEYGIDTYGTELYETEEERRRRLAEEAEANMPTKQTITYDNKTGAQKVKIEGSATNLSAMNPATPTVAGPVNPDDTYQRMIQAESGGRQFGPGGQVLTSPKGALGIGQIMPATAMQPGYGVTNIFDLAQQRGMPVAQRDEATARQLLGNEQLNRDFGQSYFNAMQQRFPGQPEASVAAYNAGPGRVGQNMQANAGQLNPSQLPNETQAYIQKVLDRAPQAQAQQPQPIINDQGQVVGQETPAQMVAGAATNAPIAQGPVDPAAQRSMVQTQAAAPQPGPVGEQMGPSTQFMSQPAWAERYSAALDTARNGDFGSLQSMMSDPNLPKGAKMEAIATMADNMRFEQKADSMRQEYTRGLETGDFKNMQREDRKKGGEGSWLRYIMFGLLGSPSAQIEKQRLMPELFAKPDYITMADGQTQAVIMRDDNGNAIRGTTADGRSLTQKELIENARTGLGKGTSLSAEVYVDKTTGQRYRSGYDASGNTAMLNVQGGAAFKGNPKNLEVQSIGTSIAKAEGTKAVELRYTGPIAYTKAGADFVGKFNAENDTSIGYQSQQPGAPLVDLNTGQRIVPNANGTISATKNTVGGTTTGGMTPAQIRTQTAVGEATQRVFAEKRIPEIIDEGDAGSSVARIRREQLDTIRDNPSILGIYQGRGTDYDRARNVITNVISGAYGAEDSGKLRDDLKAISISPAEKAALENFANLNMQLNAKTLKANTGGGQISGAEQKINKETNLSEIASQTPLASMQGLHRSMFVGDLNNARAGFLTANPDLNTDAKFAAAWNKEKAQANKAYEGIMRERAEFLKGYVPPRNPTPAQYAAFNERVFKAFEMYPAPRWDSEQNKWNYQTKNAELAAARALGR
jgi:hypothetical protein